MHGVIRLQFIKTEEIYYTKSMHPIPNDSNENGVRPIVGVSRYFDLARSTPATDMMYTN